MSEKHTPGPWRAGDAAWYRGRAKDDTESGKRPITAVGHPVVANVYGRANAHLIAAAPDLLDALKAVTHRTDLGTALFHKLTEEHAEAALAAIAKAEGRS